MEHGGQESWNVESLDSYQNNLGRHFIIYRRSPNLPLLSMLPSLGVRCLAVLVCIVSASSSSVVAQSVDFSALDVDYNGTSNLPGTVEPLAETRGASDDQLKAANPTHVQWKIRSGETRVRGVNLGGWLVSEQWMTAEAPMYRNLPRDDDIKGEFQVLKKGGDTDMRLREYQNHHATFVMEKDIQAIANAGLNTVRVPVGYWITGSDPYDADNKEWQVFPKNTLQYLDKLIREWALAHNVAVLVSIHAARGSQNGEDHSAPTVTKHAYWSEYASNVKNTLYVAEFLAKRYKDGAAFLGLGLLNEPMAQTDEKVLNQYYQDAYRAVRATGSDCVLSIMPLLYKQTADNLVGFMEKPAFTNVWVEWHPYFIWGYETVSAEELVTKSIGVDFQKKITAWTSRANANRMFFGEWSFASSGQFTNPNTAAFQKWVSTMTKAMNQATAGWTYWSWRVYGDDAPGAFNGWSMRSVLNKAELKKIIMG